MVGDGKPKRAKRYLALISRVFLCYPILDSVPLELDILNSFGNKMLCVPMASRFKSSVVI